MTDKNKARTIIEQRKAACRKVEDELRASGRHEEADLLRSLRIGYASAIETASGLSRANNSLLNRIADLERRDGVILIRPARDGE
jgi:hypothetical protein